MVAWVPEFTNRIWFALEAFTDRYGQHNGVLGGDGEVDSSSAAFQIEGSTITGGRGRRR